MAQLQWRYYFRSEAALLSSRWTPTNGARISVFFIKQANLITSHVFRIREGGREAGTSTGVIRVGSDFKTCYSYNTDIQHLGLNFLRVCT